MSRTVSSKLTRDSLAALVSGNITAIHVPRFLDLRVCNSIANAVRASDRFSGPPGSRRLGVGIDSLPDNPQRYFDPGIDVSFILLDLLNQLSAVIGPIVFPTWNSRSLRPLVVHEHGSDFVVRPHQDWDLPKYPWAQNKLELWVNLGPPPTSSKVGGSFRVWDTAFDEASYKKHQGGSGPELLDTAVGKHKEHFFCGVGGLVVLNTALIHAMSPLAEDTVRMMATGFLSVDRTTVSLWS